MEYLKRNVRQIFVIFEFFFRFEKEILHLLGKILILIGYLF